MLTALEMNYHGYWQYRAELGLKLWEQCRHQVKEAVQFVVWDRVLNPLDQANKRELQTALAEPQ